jgi:hypothetical protein
MKPTCGAFASKYHQLSLCSQSCVGLVFPWQRTVQDAFEDGTLDSLGIGRISDFVDLVDPPLFIDKHELKCLPLKVLYHDSPIASTTAPSKKVLIWQQD